MLFRKNIEQGNVYRVTQDFRKKSCLCQYFYSLSYAFLLYNSQSSFASSTKNQRTIWIILYHFWYIALLLDNENLENEAARSN